VWLAAAVIAIVTQDATPLRSAPRAGAARNAVLWQGEALEVRGSRSGYLQVYDYRRERGGYVLDWQVRRYPLETTSAASVLEAVRLLRDLRGLEALGIGHAALYLRLAPAQEIGAEVFDALGVMADRLARRSSLNKGVPGETVAGHLDVARGYGLHMFTADVEGSTLVCYDGEAFARVLQIGGTPEEAARAALGLTRPGCETAQTEAQRQADRQSAAEVLDAVDLAHIPSAVQQHVHLRRVGVWSALAFYRGRAGDAAGAQTAARRAVDELALVDPGQLAETDLGAYTEAALLAAASQPAGGVSRPAVGHIDLVLTPKQSGETCISVVRKGAAKGSPAAPPQALFQRCTYGQVWPASLHVSPRDDALAVAVQPLAGWRELWVFHVRAGEWTVDPVVPSGEPGLGYVEWAGWTPDGTRMLAVREVRVEGRFVRSFELLRLATMAVERKAERPQDLTPFYRWQAPEWKGQTLALR
jgi:hypothetical protein